MDKFIAAGFVINSILCVANLFFYGWIDARPSALAAGLMGGFAMIILSNRM